MEVIVLAILQSDMESKNKLGKKSKGNEAVQPWQYLWRHMAKPFFHGTQFILKVLVSANFMPAGYVSTSVAFNATSRQ